MRNLHQEVTQRILQQLEAGALPWVKPWSQTPGSNISCNAISNRPYSGCNAFLLWLLKRPNPRYLTFKQAKEAGGNVRKGESGVPVYFVKHLYRKGEVMKDGRTAESNISMLRQYWVFNVDQCDGLPDKVKYGPAGAPQPLIENADERNMKIERFIKATGADIHFEGDVACYVPSADFIRMPPFASFHGAGHFYATTFHELGHWTGHEKRCNREFGKRFGDKAYAAEELVAELTAAFLCAEFNIDGELRHAGYIEHWIKLLRDDNKAFFTAASAAQKAADFIRGTVTVEAQAEAA